MTRRARVRPLLQLAPADCGPACLRMVLGYFGRHISAQELNPETVSARDGVTAAWLVSSAETQGLYAEGFEVTVDQLAALPTPAILHTTSAHFVVFEGLDGDRIVVVDPSVGVRWFLDRTEARALLSGTAIGFEPSERFERRSRGRYARDVLSPVLTLDRWAAILVAFIFVALAASSAAIGSSGFWSSLAGDSSPNTSAYSLLYRTVALAVLFVLWAGSLTGVIESVVRSQVSARLAQLESRPLGAGALGKVGQRASMPGVSYFEGLDPRASTTFPQTSRFVLAIAALLGAALAAWLSGRSVSILLAAFVVALAVSLLVARLKLRHGGALAEHAIWGAHLVLCVGIWFDCFHLGSLVSAHLEGAIALRATLAAIAPTALLAVAVFRVGTAATVASQWYAMFVRRREGLPRDASCDGDDTAQLPAPREAAAAPSAHSPRLSVRGITLRLGDQRDRLLADLHFDLRDGEHIALVGPAGVGKSTLARALLGRVAVSPGSILYDGRALTEYPPSERERMVSGATQGERLPDSTIARIVRASNRDMSPRALRSLCAQLGVDDELSSLPLGYDTPVYLDGETLSRGQRQMLLLAQAVASGARVLVLDDPVNALDDTMARRVLEGLATLPTTVVLTMASASALRGLDFRVVDLAELRSRSHVNQLELSAVSVRS